MKKIILFITLSFIALTKAMDQNQNLELMRWKLIAMQLINFEKINSAQSLLDLNISGLYSFSLISKMHAEITKYLLSEKRNINGNEISLKEFYILKEKEFIHQMREESYEKYKKFLSYLSNENESDWIQLIAAIYNYNKDLVKFILLGKETISWDIESISDENKAGILKHVSLKSNFTVDQSVFDGKNINAQDEYGWTPLIHAVLSGDFQIVEILLKEEANIYIKDKFGKTALMWAREFGYQEIIDLIKEYENINRVKIQTKIYESEPHCVIQ